MDQPQGTLGEGLTADGAAGPASDATSTALPPALMSPAPMSPALMSPAVLARLIQKRDVRAVKSLLAAGLDPNAPDPATGMLPIVMAADMNNIPMLTALLEAGADINAPTNREGTTTTLSYAVANCGLATVKALLDAGANPNVQGEEGSTVLVEAILDPWEEGALMLIAAGAHANHTDGSIPPLHAAALKGQERVVSALLAAGASATSRHRIQDAAHQSNSTAAGASHQETGQSTAAGNAHSAVQAQAPDTPGDERGAAGEHLDPGPPRQSAHSQARRSPLQRMSLLLEGLSHLAPDGLTALDMAAAAGRSAVLTLILSQQPRPSKQVLSSALACAATHLLPASRPPAKAAPKGLQLQSPAPIQDHFRAMELLLDAGADPNLSCLSTEADAQLFHTPLMISAMKGELATVRLLLRAGADVNAARGGATALSIACMLGNAALVKELLSAGASLHANSNVQFVQACKGNSAETFDLLLAAGMEVAPDSRGMPPIVNAAALGADAVVGRLLSAGASIEQPDTSGLTALYYASTLTADERAQGRLRALKVLLAAGADPNARQGLYRPLSSAASSGNVEAVQLLLAGGAEFNAAHRGGRTPLQVAAAAGHEGVVSVLLAAGADPRPALASVEAVPQPSTLGAAGVRKLLREACDRLDAAALADRLAAELIAQEEEEEGRGGSAASGGQATRKRKGKGRPKGHHSQQPAAKAAPGMAAAEAAAAAVAPAAAAAAVPSDSGGRSGGEVVVESGSHVQSAGGAVVEGGGHVQIATVLPVAASGRVDAASPISSLVGMEELQALTLSFSQQAALHEGKTGDSSGQVAGEGGLDSWCVVCMERRHNTVLVPCAHAVLCTYCCAAVQAANNECPMCREPIEAVLQLQV